jgi:hypothetical protein
MKMKFFLEMRPYNYYKKRGLNSTNSLTLLEKCASMKKNISQQKTWFELYIICETLAKQQERNTRVLVKKNKNILTHAPATTVPKLIQKA